MNDAPAMHTSVPASVPPLRQEATRSVVPDIEVPESVEPVDPADPIMAAKDFTFDLSIFMIPDDDDDDEVLPMHQRRPLLPPPRGWSSASRRCCLL